jgi:nitric oxide reductase NorE protein
MPGHTEIMSSPPAVTFYRSNARIPGEEGIWILIFGDLVVFSLFFIIFLYYRGQNPELFDASQAHLNQALGAINTLLMLSSSWFVATAVQAARKNLARLTQLCFLMAFACGVAFGVVKALEYAEKIRAGITLNTNDFYMYYFVFTGIHFLHVLIGMGVLSVLAVYSRAGAFNESKIRHFESGASFWHLVDLLWIVLFALLYLIK